MKVAASKYRKEHLSMNIVTEEMKYRQRLCEYALTHGVTKAARRYHTYRQFVYRRLARYDGTVKSPALKSRKPKHSPTAHSDEERQLIRHMLRRNGNYGPAEVYVGCRYKGYTRSFSSMCRQIRKYGYKRPSRKRKSYTRYRQETGIENSQRKKHVRDSNISARPGKRNGI